MTHSLGRVLEKVLDSYSENGEVWRSQSQGNAQIEQNRTESYRTLLIKNFRDGILKQLSALRCTIKFRKAT